MELQGRMGFRLQSRITSTDADSDNPAIITVEDIPGLH